MFTLSYDSDRKDMLINLIKKIIFFLKDINILIIYIQKF